MIKGNCIPLRHFFWVMGSITQTSQECETALTSQHGTLFLSGLQRFLNVCFRHEMYFLIISLVTALITVWARGKVPRARWALSHEISGPNFLLSLILSRFLVLFKSQSMWSNPQDLQTILSWRNVFSTHKLNMFTNFITQFQSTRRKLVKECNWLETQVDWLMTGVHCIENISMSQFNWWCCDTTLGNTNTNIV